MTPGQSGTSENINRFNESREALNIIGCQQIFHLNFEDTRTYLYLNDMIHALEDIIYNKTPDGIEIVRAYTMHNADRHQDHMAVYQASMVSCRGIPQILGYETPSTFLSFVPQVFESIEEEDFELKIKALSKHKSQSHRYYMRPKHLRVVAHFRGCQINKDYAEGFVIHKMIL